MNDGNMTLWRALGVNSWPTLAVVSPRGRLIGMLPGECRGLYTTCCRVGLCAARCCACWEEGSMVHDHRAVRREGQEHCAVMSCPPLLWFCFGFPMDPVCQYCLTPCGTCRVQCGTCAFRHPCPAPNPCLCAHTTPPLPHTHFITTTYYMQRHCSHHSAHTTPPHVSCFDCHIDITATLDTTALCTPRRRGQPAEPGRHPGSCLILILDSLGC